MQEEITKLIPFKLSKIKTMKVSAIILFAFICVRAEAFAFDYQGDIDPYLKNDSLFVKYQLEYKAQHIDSILFKFVGPIESTVYYPWVKLEKTFIDSLGNNNRQIWQGTIEYGAYTKIPNRFIFKSFYQLDRDTVVLSKTAVDTLSFKPEGVFGRSVNAGIIVFDRSRFDPPITSNSNFVALQVEDKFGYCDKYYSLYGGYSIIYSKKFSLYDYFRIRGELIPFGKEKFLPVVFGGVTYSRIKGYNDPYEFTQKGFGFEAGISIEGKFEKLIYTHSSAVGGYDRLDLVFAMESGIGGNKYFGTMYSIYRGEYVNMYSVNIYMSASFNNNLSYKDNRPFIIKGISYVVLLPALPIGLLKWGLWKLSKGDSTMD